MDAKKVVVSGIAAGVAIFIVSYIVDSIIVALLPYNILELGGMRSVEDPLMMLFFLSPLVTGLAMAVLWSYTKSVFRGTVVEKGTLFGLLVWLVAALPSAYIVFTSMDYPLGFTVSSTVGALLYMLAAGLVIAKLG